MESTVSTSRRRRQPRAQGRPRPAAVVVGSTRSTVAWDLPAGGLWIGLPLGVAAIVLGIRARRELAGEAGSRIAIAAIALATLAIGQMVVWLSSQLCHEGFTHPPFAHRRGHGRPASPARPPRRRRRFPGKAKADRLQRFVDPEDEENSQIFSIARPGANARKLTSGGSGFNPDATRPERRKRMVFKAPVWRREARLARHIRLRRLVSGACRDDLLLGSLPGRQQPRLVTRREPARVRTSLRADRQGQRGGTRPGLHTNPDGSSERGDPALPFAGGRGRNPMTLSGRPTAGGSP